MPGAPTYQPLINQAVQILMDSKPEPLCGVVTNCLADEFVIRFPQHGQLPKGLAAGTSVILRCADAAGLHTAKTAVVEVFPSPRPGVVLRNPQHFDLVQNRRFLRVEVAIPCSLQHIGESGLPLARDMDDKARIQDLSVGGALVSTLCHVAVGERVQLVFVTEPVESPPLELKAKVVRISELACDRPGTRHVGMEFEELGKQTQDRLMDLIFEAQRSMCRLR